MSIHDVIEELVKAGQLSWFELNLDSDPWVRDMLVTPELKGLLKGPWSNERLEKRCNRLQADLETFVKGKMVRACLTPYKAESAYMGRLDKPIDEVWDIRSVDPSPALRVFGRFADTDCFIAFTCYPRSKPVEGIDRPVLGDSDSAAWKSAINECKNEWRKILPTYEPVHGDNINDYISDNVVSI